MGISTFPFQDLHDTRRVFFSNMKSALCWFFFKFCIYDATSSFVYKKWERTKYYQKSNCSVRTRMIKRQCSAVNRRTYNCRLWRRPAVVKVFRYVIIKRKMQKSERWTKSVVTYLGCLVQRCKSSFVAGLDTMTNSQIYIARNIQIQFVNCNHLIIYLRQMTVLSESDTTSTIPLSIWRILYCRAWGISRDFIWSSVSNSFFKQPHGSNHKMLLEVYYCCVHH